MNLLRSIKEWFMEKYHIIMFKLDLPVKNEWLPEPAPPGFYPEGTDAISIENLEGNNG
jgi:hypothetical protein